MEKHKMTAEEARTFKHGLSEAHIALLAEASAERGCECLPYIDWFTYNRWQAQDIQVQKGEHGVKLTTWIAWEVEKNGKTEIRRRPKTTSVFCRHQTKPKG